MITVDDICIHLLKAEYAVRGPIAAVSDKRAEKGQVVIACNIGNPQQLGQPPLSYIRNTLAILENPLVLRREFIVKELYGEATYNRAMNIIKELYGGLDKYQKNVGLPLGAYTQSIGIPFIRKAVAKFITRRDGITADPNYIILTDGASKGVELVISALVKDANSGVMTPVPQYPLYSALLTKLNAKKVDYYQDEDDHWQFDSQELERAYSSAKAQGINCKLLVIINPNNPTGALLEKSKMEEILRFAQKHNLAIIADEVYQENIYDDGCKFVSFAKVMDELKITDVSLFSLNSTSKGFLGECGYRGGYLEMRNIPVDVKDVFVKLQSMFLCANTNGQLMTYLMVTPPVKGELDYEEYVYERDYILQSLSKKRKLLARGLNSIEGVSVEIPKGAMYLFPKITLPNHNDNDFCLKLVEETGIATVSGSGMGQKEGTNHLRITFLPPEDEIPTVVEEFKQFYQKYSAKHK